jgi:toxin ParE1/3/4
VVYRSTPQADRDIIGISRNGASPPVRLHPYRSHMIVYLLREDDILIVRILHGRQEWELHL